MSRDEAGPPGCRHALTPQVITGGRLLVTRHPTSLILTPSQHTSGNVTAMCFMLIHFDIIIISMGTWWKVPIEIMTLLLFAYYTPHYQSKKNTPQGRWLGAAETNQVITGSQEALKQQETWNFKIKEGTLDPGRGCRTWTRSSFCFKVEDLRYSSIVHPRDHYHTLLHVCLHEKGWDSEVNRCVYIKHTGSVSTGPFVNSRDTVNRKRWGGRGHPVFNPVGRECVHVRTDVRDQTTVMPYSPSWCLVCSLSSADTCVIWRRFHSTCGS